MYIAKFFGCLLAAILVGMGVDVLLGGGGIGAASGTALIMGRNILAK